ncbi:MAG: ribbon-helix-helix domain-containing protein [Candidatus Bathyarchaeia archaeon]
MRKKYRTVSIPEDLYDRIEDAVNNGNGGYTSVGEFVRESVRRTLRELGTKL